MLSKTTLSAFACYKGVHRASPTCNSSVFLLNDTSFYPLIPNSKLNGNRHYFWLKTVKYVFLTFVVWHFFFNMTSGSNVGDETELDQGRGYGQGIRSLLAAVCLAHSPLHPPLGSIYCIIWLLKWEKPIVNSTHDVWGRPMWDTGVWSMPHLVRPDWLKSSPKRLKTNNKRWLAQQLVVGRDAFFFFFLFFKWWPLKWGLLALLAQKKSSWLSQNVSLTWQQPYKKETGRWVVFFVFFLTDEPLT